MTDQIIREFTDGTGDTIEIDTLITGPNVYITQHSKFGNSGLCVYLHGDQLTEFLATLEQAVLTVEARAIQRDTR